MTVLDKLRETLIAERVNQSAMGQVHHADGLVIAIRFLDVFARDHRLIDVSTCGEQCPAITDAVHASGDVYSAWCCAIEDIAPVHKPCLWSGPHAVLLADDAQPKEG